MAPRSLYPSIVKTGSIAQIQFENASLGLRNKNAGWMPAFV